MHEKVLAILVFFLFFFGLAFDNGVAPLVSYICKDFSVENTKILQCISLFNLILVVGVVVGNLMVCYLSPAVSNLIIAIAAIVFGFAGYEARHIETFNIFKEVISV